MCYYIIVKGKGRKNREHGYKETGFELKSTKTPKRDYGTGGM